MDNKFTKDYVESLARDFNDVSLRYEDVKKKLIDSSVELFELFEVPGVALKDVLEIKRIGITTKIPWLFKTFQEDATLPIGLIDEDEDMYERDFNLIHFFQYYTHLAETINYYLQIGLPREAWFEGENSTDERETPSTERVDTNLGYTLDDIVALNNANGDAKETMRQSILDLFQSYDIERLYINTPNEKSIYITQSGSTEEGRITEVVIDWDGVAYVTTLTDSLPDGNFVSPFPFGEVLTACFNAIEYFKSQNTPKEEWGNMEG